MKNWCIGSFRKKCLDCCSELSLRENKNIWDASCIWFTWVPINFSRWNIDIRKKKGGKRRHCNWIRGLFFSFNDTWEKFSTALSSAVECLCCGCCLEHVNVEIIISRIESSKRIARRQVYPFQKFDVKFEMTYLRKEANGYFIIFYTGT